MQYKGFTKQARKAMRLAENLAEKEQQTQMGSEYLLAGLLLEGHGVAYEILQQLSVNCEDILARSTRSHCQMKKNFRHRRIS